jgi:16S rRNA (uracil1498-N3)-methyltransferase
MKIRIYYNATLFLQQKIILTNDDFHYLKNVLRVKIRHEIFVFNSEVEYKCTLNEINKTNIIATVVEQSGVNKIRPFITLFCPMVKKDAMHNIIRQCCEFGLVKIIIPFSSEYSSVKEISTQKIQLIAKEAIEQCEAFIVPEVSSVIPFNAIISNFRLPILFGDEIAARKDGKPHALPQINGEIGVIIGPEGGFSAIEIAALRTTDNFTSTKLASTILRSDTACVAIISQLATAANKNFNN